MKTLFIPILLFGLLSLTFAAAPASAERFIDIYGGTHSTDDGEVSVTEQSFLGQPQNHSKTLEFDNGSVFGGRYGVWFEYAPWLAFAGDISYFKSEAEESEITMIPVSVLAMVRYSMFTSPQYPYGRVQPYIGAGPSLMLYDLEIDLSEKGGGSFNESSSDLGVDLRAGLSLQLTEKVALFGEYRYTHVELDYDSDEDELYVPLFYDLEIDTDMTTHHFLFGLSYRF